MLELQNIYKSIRDNHVRSINNPTIDDLALSVNLLQIPNDNIVVMTITIMKDFKKKNAIPSLGFARVMKNIEDITDILSESREPDDLLFSTLVDIPVNWYKSLNCHRVILISEDSVMDFVSSFIERSNLKKLKLQDLKQIYLFVCVNKYKFSMIL